MLVVELLRHIHDLTQDELGTATGIGQSRIAAFENKKRTPTVDEMRALARFFDVREDQAVRVLFAEPDPPAVVFPERAPDPPSLALKIVELRLKGVL